MQIYEITYSLDASGVMNMTADSKEEAKDLFKEMNMNDLFQMKDVHITIKAIESD